MDVTCNLKVRKKDVRDHLTEILPFRQGRRQVKIGGVDRHGERGARVYNGGLGAERPPYPSPCKNSSDLYQFQERPLAKVGVDMSIPVQPVAMPLLSVGSLQHSCDISSLIMADWSLHYIVQNFKRFFLPSPEIPITER